MPIWEAPDEPAHYHLAWRVARGKSYPTYEHNYEANQPRAYYYAASLVIRGLDQIDPKFSDYYVPRYEPRNYRKPTHMYEWTDGNYHFRLGVYSLRWLNILIGGAALWCFWSASRLLAPEAPWLRVGALALAALTPQYLHIMSSVSNDAVGTLAGAALFYLGIRFMKEPSTWLGLVVLVLAFALPFITKLTVLPVSAAVLLIVAGTWLFGLGSRRWLVFAGLAVLLSAGVIYIFFPEILQTAWGEVEWRLSGFRRNAFTGKYLRFILGQVMWTYWGKVGWVAIGLHKSIIYGLTTLGLLGMIVQAHGLIRDRGKDFIFSSWVATLLVGIFTTLAVFRNALSTAATQGRLLFPAIGVLSILMVAGWHRILPARLRQHLPVLIVLMLLISTLTLWAWGVVPVYYQPFLD